VLDQVNLRHVQYFVTVAEELHFGRAAARLHMSTPPLSQRIRQLERDLGVMLFERSSRRVELTEDGRALLGPAQALLAAANAFERAAAERGHDLIVRLGFSHGSEGPVMSALQSFHTTHPHIAVRADGLTSGRIFEALRLGRLDMGVARAPAPDDDVTTSIPLARVPLDLLAVPLHHPLARRRSVSVDLLEGETLLLVDENDSPTVHRSTVAFFDARGVHPRWLTHSATQTERALDQVAAGLGCAWVNRWQAVAARKRRDLRVVRLAEAMRLDEFIVVHRIDTQPAWFVPLIDTLLVAARAADDKLGR
jgi:DNA-binding transcriptional LysR family regulator